MDFIFFDGWIVIFVSNSEKVTSNNQTSPKSLTKLTLTDVFLKDYHIRYYYTLPQTPTPPPYTNNKCNRNKGLLLTKPDTLCPHTY